MISLSRRERRVARCAGTSYDTDARRLSGSTYTLLGAARRESARMSKRQKPDLVISGFVLLRHRRGPPTGAW